MPQKNFRAASLLAAFTVLLSACGLSLGTPLSGDQGASAARPDPAARQTAETLIRDALRLRNSFVLSEVSSAAPSRSAEQLYTPAALPGVLREQKYLRDKTQKLVGFGVRYTGAETTVTVDSFTQEGELATAEVVETTTLTVAPMAGEGSSPPTRYVYPQRVRLHRDPAGWLIESIKNNGPRNAALPSTVQPDSAR